MNSVGDRLREARLARGLTQEQLAKGLATKGFISQIERNRTTPSLPKLRMMAERLGLPLGHFTDDKSPHELTYLRKSAELAVKAQEPERALDLVNEGLALPATANERAELLRIQGVAFEALSRLNDALASLQTAAATAPPDDPELSAAIYADIGYVQQQQEQFNAATEANLRALGWLDASKHADPALRARVLTNLGRTCYALGQLEKADEHLQRALDAAIDAESRLRIANAHMALGISARAVGDLARAVEHCNRALDLHSRIGEHRAANRVLNNLGDVHYAAGRKREATALQQRCLARAREIRDDFEIGVAAGALARYDLDDNRVDDALAHAREARQASERSGDHLHLAVAAALEGEAVERQGNASIADRHFAFALRLLKERNAAGKLAEVCAMYADVLRSRGEDDRAFSFMRMAAERDFSKLGARLRK
ncbi:MAG TPA: helix-turn-helix transcriptional regulator [Candidatus Dormibacteraeota bacterium]|nr:helix-turn-helix transcriptional regulator [Candidatus Dormibacteraeota bacterium]